jgi:hypothetical protein
VGNINQGHIQEDNYGMQTTLLVDTWAISRSRYHPAPQPKDAEISSHDS